MDAPAHSRIRLSLLGNFTIAGGGGADLTPSSKKLRALVGCLALPIGTPWPRDKLIAMLWGDRSDEQVKTVVEALHDSHPAPGSNAQ